MSHYLEQTRRESRGQYKYSVDCDKIQNDPTALTVLNGNVRAKHTMVINAVVKEFHNKQNKIVVKIGKTNELVRQEYNVAKKLNDAGMHGFIRMDCVFSCKHSLEKYKIGEQIDEDSFQVCELSGKDEVDVIIMPFIGKGITLNHYLESGGDAEHYKKILKQVVENLFDAFVKTGFVHCDLHFGNILIDDDGNPIIMDFDTSAFVSQSVSQWRFWADMHRIIGMVIEKGYPSNSKSYAVSNALSISIMINTLLYASTTDDAFARHVQNIVNLIDVSSVNFIDASKQVKSVYNPIVFGGIKRVSRKKKK